MLLVVGLYWKGVLSRGASKAKSAGDESVVPPIAILVLSLLLLIVTPPLSASCSKSSQSIAEPVVDDVVGRRSGRSFKNRSKDVNVAASPIDDVRMNWRRDEEVAKRTCTVTEKVDVSAWVG